MHMAFMHSFKCAVPVKLCVLRVGAGKFRPHKQVDQSMTKEKQKVKKKPKIPNSKTLGSMPNVEGALPLVISDQAPLVIKKDNIQIPRQNRTS